MTQADRVTTICLHLPLKVERDLCIAQVTRLAARVVALPRSKPVATHQARTNASEGKPADSTDSFELIDDMVIPT